MGEKKRVLIICAKGSNRSPYLAKYLRREGYSTTYGGIEEHIEKPVMRYVTWKMVNWAEIIIIVKKRLKKLFDKKFRAKGKKIIILNVTDSKRLIPKKFADLKELGHKEFQKKWTYPQLRKAIKPYLPL